MKDANEQDEKHIPAVPERCHCLGTESKLGTNWLIKCERQGTKRYLISKVIQTSFHRFNFSPHVVELCFNGKNIRDVLRLFKDLVIAVFKFLFRFDPGFLINEFLCNIGSLNVLVFNVFTKG